MLRYRYINNDDDITNIVNTVFNTKSNVFANSISKDVFNDLDVKSITSLSTNIDI